MPIMPCTVVTFIADKGFTGWCDHGSFVTVVRGDDAMEPHCISRSHTRSCRHHNRSVPRSSSCTQRCYTLPCLPCWYSSWDDSTGQVHSHHLSCNSVSKQERLSRQEVGGVRVGDTVTTGGFPAVHPLTIIKPARTSRRMNNKPEVFRAMVPDIMGDMIIIWGYCGSGEMGMNLYVHTRRMKIVLYTMHPRLRASPRHGGHGVLVTDPPGVSCFGAAAFIVPDGGVTSSASYCNKAIFIGNTQYQATCSRGFHPRRFGSPKMR